MYTIKEKNQFLEQVNDLYQKAKKDYLITQIKNELIKKMIKDDREVLQTLTSYKFSAVWIYIKVFTNTLMICFTKKKKDDSDNPDNQIEKIRLSNPKSSCLKAIRIFTIEQRQISCLDYDLKEHEWFLIKSDMSLQNTKKDDLQLTETI